MNIAHTGNGNIGTRLEKLGSVPLSIKSILDSKDVRQAIERVKPDVIVHTVAISSPDRCEKHPELARAVNVWGTAKLCEWAEEIIGTVGNCRVVLLSTDHVFEGKKLAYKENDDPLPISEYGRTKFAAEGVVQLYGGKVIRLSRGFDSKSADIAEYIKLLLEGSSIQVPEFIIRSYCHFDLLVQGVFEHANRYDEMPEILHVAGGKTLSFYDFMGMVGKELGHPNKVVRRSYKLPELAPRPEMCGLDVSLAKSLSIPIFDTEQSIRRLAEELK